MLLAFFLKGIVVGVVIAVPVGPVGVMCVRRTILEGRLAGFVSGLGAATADAVFGVIAGFGLTAVSDWLIDYQQWLRVVGGCYLLYIGGSAFAAEPPRELESESDPEGLLRDFFSTFVLAVTNPITVLAFLGIFAAIGLGGTQATFGHAVDSGSRGLGRLVAMVADVEFRRRTCSAFDRTAPSRMDKPRFGGDPFPFGSGVANHPYHQLFALTPINPRQAGDDHVVYLPPAFTEARPAVLVAHIEHHDFGLLVSHGAAGLIASHIPFLVEHHGEELHLLCHLARPNPQVEDLSHSEEVLTIFSGPHAYVSPSWYAAGPAVPTWNYVDVHAYGTVRLVEDGDWLRRLLLRLSDRHEAASPAPWRCRTFPSHISRGCSKGSSGSTSPSPDWKANTS